MFMTTSSPAASASPAPGAAPRPVALAVPFAVLFAVPFAVSIIDVGPLAAPMVRTAGRAVRLAPSDYLLTSDGLCPCLECWTRPEPRRHPNRRTPRPAEADRGVVSDRPSS